MLEINPLRSAYGFQALNSGFLDVGTWIPFLIACVIPERLLEQNSGFQIPAFRILQAKLFQIPVCELTYIKDATPAG